MAEDSKRTPNWGQTESTPVLKLTALPVSIIMIALGIMTILGGHITDDCRRNYILNSGLWNRRHSD